MGWKNTHDSKIDPSDIKQKITTINLQVHCCRYWKLTEWEFQNLSVPFWRIYYNTEQGAKIAFKNKEIGLCPTKVLLIPPYTSFSTSLKACHPERISGNRIQSFEELAQLNELGMVDHLFIHFNLGFQYDHLQPSIFEYEVDKPLQKLLDQIRYSIIEEYRHLSFRQMLHIHSLIIQLVDRIPVESWKEKTTDSRVLKVIDYIDLHFPESLTNDFLAAKATMAPNSFLRLFKSVTGFTLQQFVQNKRIEKAILMMHNQESSIDQIAEKCGFSDRQHFSKVFKRIAKIPPAQYRKTQAM